MMNNELNPCPFCNGKAKYRYKLPFNWVECKKCKAHTQVIVDSYEQTDGKQEVIGLWNEGNIFKNEATNM